MNEKERRMPFVIFPFLAVRRTLFSGQGFLDLYGSIGESGCGNDLQT